MLLFDVVMAVLLPMGMMEKVECILGLNLELCIRFCFLCVQIIVFRSIFCLFKLYFSGLHECTEFMKYYLNLQFIVLKMGWVFSTADTM